MESKGLVRDEFNALRVEINGTRARAFWILCMGSFGVPIMAYIASTEARQVMPLVPLAALVLIIAYLTEVNNMMRAARYIRENIETDPDNAIGWEAWLEGNGHHRLMETLRRRSHRHSIHLLLHDSRACLEAAHGRHDR